MLGQVLLRKRWFGFTVALCFQSCRVWPYLQIRGCTAKPLYCLAFYLKEEAGLAPAALFLSVSLSVHLPVSVAALGFFFQLHVFLPLLSLSLSPLSFACHLFLLRRPSLTGPHSSTVNLMHLFRCEKCVKLRSVICGPTVITFTHPLPGCCVIIFIKWKGHISYTCFPCSWHYTYIHPHKP